MALGYGYGGEGDWKVAAMTAILKAMSEGQTGGTGFMEDYTIISLRGRNTALAHTCSKSVRRSLKGGARIETHHLGIGMNEKDPARLVFEGQSGQGDRCEPN